MLKRLLVFLCAYAALSSAAMAGTAMHAAPGLPPQPSVRPAGIPPGDVMLSPCIAGMGEHWAKLSDMPVGPIYGTYQGKPVFTEIMVSKTQLDKGFNFYNLKPLPGYTIDHVNVEWHPHGHEGMPVPHYDVHAYYISHAAQLKICPKGIPDPDMERVR